MATPSASQFADQLNAQYPGKRINDPAYPGGDVGQQWLGYYAAHSGAASLATLEQAFADIIALEDLKGGLTAAAAATGTAENQAITGAAKGAIQITSWQQGLEAIGRFFAGLGQASTWLRVAEVLLGAGIIIVAAAKLASGTSVGQAAQKAGKAAMIL